MDKRIFICADVCFPRGTAGANRIFAIAKGFNDLGFRVLILASDNTGRLHGTYSGIEYICSSIKKEVEKRVFSGISLRDMLKQYKPNSDDVIFVYGTNASFVYPLLKYAKHNKIECIIDVVEWHQSFQYKYGGKDLRYLSSKASFERLAPKFDKIIAISEYIKHYYELKNKKCYVLPALVDGSSAPQLAKKDSTVVRFIYPGNPFGKDDFITMIKAIDGLSDDEKSRFSFSITGVSEQKIRDNMGIDFELIERNRACIKIIGMIQYDKLLEIFSESDFLFFARPDNIVTRANFPSKVPELMMNGVIPVCPKIGEFWHYLNDGVDSILYEGNTVDSCVGALRKAINIKDIFSMKKNAQVSSLNKFDYRKWWKILKEVIES